jgi:hypothetical protein
VNSKHTVRACLEGKEFLYKTVEKKQSIILRFKADKKQEEKFGKF